MLSSTSIDIVKIDIRKQDCRRKVEKDTKTYQNTAEVKHTLDHEGWVVGVAALWGHY